VHEFDSSEICELLVMVQAQLVKTQIDLKIIVISDIKCAETGSIFCGLPLDFLLVEPDAMIHEELHAGPGWYICDFVSDEVSKCLLGILPCDILTSPTWLLNSLTMCIGIGAP